MLIFPICSSMFTRRLYFRQPLKLTGICSLDFVGKTFTTFIISHVYALGFRCYRYYESFTSYRLREAMDQYEDQIFLCALFYLRGSLILSFTSFNVRLWTSGNPRFWYSIEKQQVFILSKNSSFPNCSINMPVLS